MSAKLSLLTGWGEGISVRGGSGGGAARVVVVDNSGAQLASQLAWEARFPEGR